MRGGGEAPFPVFPEGSEEEGEGVCCSLALGWWRDQREGRGGSPPLRGGGRKPVKAQPQARPPFPRAAVSPRTYHFFLVLPTTLHRVPDLTSNGLVHPRFPALSPYVGNNRIWPCGDSLLPRVIRLPVHDQLLPPCFKFPPPPFSEARGAVASGEGRKEAFPFPSCSPGINCGKSP